MSAGRRKKYASERQVQCGIIQAARMLANQDERWSLLCAYPLQRGNDFLWLKMRLEEGALVGWPDLFFPISTKQHHGLFIELKAPNGNLSEAQEKMLKKLGNMGFKCVVFKTDNWQKVIDYLQEWLKMADEK